MSRKTKKSAKKAAMPGVPSRSIRRAFPQVKHVVDATKNVEIIVHPRDNVEGKRKQSSNCALARAAKREYEADAAVVGLSFSYIIKGDTAVRYTTPPSVAREIVSFDRHQDFAPGKYQLSHVSPSDRTGDNRTTKRSHGTNKSAQRVFRHRTTRVREL